MPQPAPPVDLPLPPQPDSAAAITQCASNDLLGPSDTFIHRHLGPDESDVAAMLDTLGFDSLDALCDATIPESIRLGRELDLGDRLRQQRGEHELIAELRAMAEKNKVFRSFIGQGYYGTITPPVIQRNILENPGWYTQYTPYQAEISQGRLEALLNYQTMVADLTALPLANASLLDEATAAVEALIMCSRIAGQDKAWFVSDNCHPQTIEVIRTRAKSLDVMLVVGDEDQIDFNKAHSIHGVGFAGVLLQYPATDGSINQYRHVIERAHEHGAQVVMATDLLALTLITPPGELGADIAIGSSQRFGVPMGFGGPHAAFIATREEHVRKLPGRLIGVSKDAQGNPALRMAVQTREQHIKRDRATSNICTAQVLLAIMSGMYAVYHGPEGLKRIALRVHRLARILAKGLQRLGHPLVHEEFFDTLHVHAYADAQGVVEAARNRGLNLREWGDEHSTFVVSVDETTTREEIRAILQSVIDGYPELGPAPSLEEIESDLCRDQSESFARTSSFLTHPVFNTHHSETEMLRYITKLQSRDLSLVQSMISLGSCTMKLNATSEMLPVTWPEFANMHPFAPADQTEGYQELFQTLEAWLAEITGFAAISLQPNAGSQGEYAGLLAIRAYHESKDDTQRNICLIPTSAHGTNPASAICAGMNVVAIKCDERGNIDVDDLRAKVEANRDTLAAIMITYPSTHGVFEESIRDICDIVHDNGGLVYLDGANMNAQVGLCRPAEYGADVCHLNLHKTFCIPHGGGGPGVGPIGVTKELAPFLPSVSRDVSSRSVSDNASSHDSPARTTSTRGGSRVGPISAAAYGSPSILAISWVYIALMGASGLKRATQVAILNANYMAKRLEDHFDVLYRGSSGRVAHEFIIDCRSFKKSAGVEIDDIAKRLMDYGFHAPTMSFPVPGTLMIEPTESEPKAELDRLCDALISIRSEIGEIENGEADRTDNVLKGAPHTTQHIASADWTHPYSREKAVFPAPWLRDSKFWPHVGRIDNPYGDRNLMCTCAGMDGLAE